MTTTAKLKHGGGRLRIIGGQWRGRKLEFPDIPGLRPTPDRVRETLFNWLTPHLSGARCLDLYCGSGALGFEALSRGAASVKMVDSAAPVQRSIENNCVLLGCENANFERADVLTWLAQAKFGEPFNIVFVDPPYQKELLAPTIRSLRDNSAIATGGYVYIESPKSLNLDAINGWELHREKLAGNNRYCLVKLSPS